MFLEKSFFSGEHLDSISQFLMAKNVQMIWNLEKLSQGEGQSNEALQRQRRNKLQR